MEIAHDHSDKPAISIDDTAFVGMMTAISVGVRHGHRSMQAALRHRGMIVKHQKIR